MLLPTRREAGKALQAAHRHEDRLRGVLETSLDLP